MKAPSPHIAPLAALPLAGCAEDLDAIAMGFVGLAMIFVLSLFVVPAVREVYERRAFRDRMRNRRPFSPKEEARRRTRRRKAP